MLGMFAEMNGQTSEKVNLPCGSILPTKLSPFRAPPDSSTKPFKTLG